ncbi:TOBE domain-containing protein [Undibacterium arcticum]
MVTHDQEEALTMADRIVVMNQGEIEQIGTPQQVYLQPSSPFVASFVGKVNILRGTSLGDGRFRIGKLDFSCESRVDHVPAGGPVKVYLRPEDFVARDAENRTHNNAMAEVLKIEFLGAFSYLTVALEGMEQQPVLASMSLNLLKELRLKVGSKVLYGLLPERIRVYCDQDGDRRAMPELAVAEPA